MASTAIGDVAPHVIVESCVHTTLLILLVGLLMLHLEVIVLLLLAWIVSVGLLLHHHVIVRDEWLLSWIRKVSRAFLVKEYAIILCI